PPNATSTLSIGSACHPSQGASHIERCGSLDSTTGLPASPVFHLLPPFFLATQADQSPSSPGASATRPGGDAMAKTDSDLLPARGLASTGVSAWGRDDEVRTSMASR